MKRVLLYGAFLLCTQLTAQTKTFTGYYIPTSGDTIKGSFPKYSQWSRNPDKVEFVPASSPKSIQLTPSNCIAFSIDNYDDFVVFSGKRLINPIDDNAAIDNRSYFGFKDSAVNVNVFLRLVTKTPRCVVYILNDYVRTNFYYQLPGQSPEELKFKKYYDENNLHELSEYRQQFNNLFAEEISGKNLEKKLQELPYKEEEIKSFVEQLFAAKKTKQVINSGLHSWVITAGISINSIKLSGDNYDIKVRTSYSTSVSPYVSIGYILSFKRNFDRYFFFPQLRFYNYKNSGSFADGSFTRTVTFSSDLFILPELNAGANIVNKDNLRLFVYGGIGQLFTSNNKEIDKLIVPADGREYASVELKLVKMTPSVNLSAGIWMNKKILCSVTYRFLTSLQNFPAYSADHSSTQIGIGYKFKD